MDAAVSALCRDKAALGAVYDSIVAKISRAHAAAQPGAGAAGAAGPSAADEPQPMQHDGAPQNGNLQGDQQQPHGQGGLQAPNGVRLRPGDIRPPPPPPLPESLQPPGAGPADTDLSAGSDAAGPVTRLVLCSASVAALQFANCSLRIANRCPTLACLCCRMISSHS